MLNEIESDLAYEIFNTKNISLMESFKYVYNYVGIFIITECNLEERDVRIREDILNDDVLRLYFECGLGFNDILNLFDEIKKGRFKKTLAEYNSRFLCGYRYFCKYINDSVFLKVCYENLYDYFEKESNEYYTDEDFFLFISIQPLLGAKIAFKKVIPGNNSESLEKNTKIIRVKAENDLYDEFVNEEELYMDDGPEINELGEIDYRNQDEEEIDYEPDMDDMDYIQNYEFTNNEIQYENYDFDEYCDSLDEMGSEADRVVDERMLTWASNLDL
jgi:hypothetical protein